MKRIWIGLLAAAALTTACDAVRYPGDGREPPVDIPEGAPGPPPPVIPVTDPYGEEDETPDPVVTPDPIETGTEDTDPPVEVTPDPEPEPEPEPLPIKFQYYPPGELIPGSGQGTADATVYAPDIVFPVKDDPAYPQSMVWRFGGGVAGGDQCDPANFSAPWQDNFCESRSKTRNTPLCPTNKVHQGQDIRVGTAADCNELRRTAKADRVLHPAVAVEDGIIEYIGSYWLRLKGTESGNLYNYIHLNMARLEVAEFETVTAGQTLGYISNDFGSTATTFHLHFEIKVPIEGEGITHVPPYMSLVKAYERRERGRGEEIEADLVATASVPTLPEGFEIIE